MNTDWYSENFDATQALRSTSLLPPVPQAPVFDNLASCRHLLPPSDPLYFNAAKARAEQAAAKPIDKQAEIDAKRKEVMKERKKARNELPQFDLIQYLVERHTEGPLKFLHDAYTQQYKIVVHIRRVVDMRGTCIGRLVAFDKHFNLIMTGVEEDFTVYCQVEDRARKDRDDDEPSRRAPRRKLVPKHRHNPHIFIKGDTIALISRFQEPV